MANTGDYGDCTIAAPSEYYATLDRPTAASGQCNLAPTMDDTLRQMVDNANAAHAAMRAQFELLPPWARPQQAQLWPDFVPPRSQFIAPLAEGENPHSFERLHMYECGARAQRPEIHTGEGVRGAIEAAMQAHAPVGIGRAVAAAIKEREAEIARNVHKHNREMAQLGAIAGGGLPIERELTKTEFFIEGQS